MDHEEFLARRRARDIERRRADPKLNEAAKAKARAYYYKMRATQPELMRARWRKYQQRNKRFAWFQEKSLRYQRKYLAWKRANDPAWVARRKEKQQWYHYNVLKPRLALEVDVSLDCERGCGRRTLHPSGACKTCRTTKCRKCQKVLIMNFIGQRLHERCIPKGVDLVV